MGQVGRVGNPGADVSEMVNLFCGLGRLENNYYCRNT